MKKIVSLFFTLLLMTSYFHVNADVFVPSIGSKHDVDFDAEGYSDEDNYTVTINDENSVISYIADDGCNVEIVLTPYIYRHTIASDASKTEMEEAMESIQNAASVGDLHESLQERVDIRKLVVSNLIDITVYVHLGQSHDQNVNHKHLYNIKLSAEALKNFEALLHYNYETKEWELVEDAYVSGVNKDTLTFTFRDASPFAIITKTELADNGVVIETGHVCCPIHINGHCYCIWLLILLIISLLLNIVLLVTRNNKKEDETKE